MDFATARAQMVASQVRTWDVVDDRVLQVMSDVPRERFLPDAWQNAAYADLPVPIGEGQVTFTPRVEGRLLQALGVRDGDRALEIGCGSGYLTACLVTLGATVTAIDNRASLAQRAEASLNAVLGSADAVAHPGFQVSHQDLAERTSEGTFDLIVAGGAIAGELDRLETKLTEGGRLFAVTGTGPVMTAWRVERAGSDRWQREALFETVLPYLDGFAPAAALEF